MKLSHVLIGLILALPYLCSASDSQPDTRGLVRYVEDQVLVSESLPAINIQVAEEFKYLGRFDIEIIATSDEYEKDLLGKTIAAGERFLFAVVDPQRQIEKMFIVQFEGWLPDIDITYNYRFDDDHIMAGKQFRHNTWFYDAKHAARNNPKGEGARTALFLEQQGYHLTDELMMSRFLALASEDRKNEIIIYYLEGLNDTTGLTLPEWEQLSETKKGQAIRAAFVERSRQSFYVSESN